MLGLLLLPFLSFAQQEANIWHIGNGNILDFNTSPVTVRNEDMNRIHNISSGTYTDKNGKLVFSVSYEGIFNSDGSLMPNGEMGNRISPDDIQIVPKPGERDIYYVFYVGSMIHGAPEFKDVAVMYAIVDFTGNRSKGVIREKMSCSIPIFTGTLRSQPNARTVITGW